MGLILDTCLFIASERSKLDLAGFLQSNERGMPAISAITVSELLHGVERATEASRRRKREEHVEEILAALVILPFGTLEARVHARIWASLERQGMMVGPHDLQIAATALSHGYELATLNVQEFRRVPDLQVLDASRYAL